MAKLLFFVSGVTALAEASSFAKSGEVRSDDVKQLFETEFAAPSGGPRLSAIEDGLRATFTSLPKNAHGNLGHDAVRYVLHRYFVQNNGWFIKGLEPNGDTWSDTTDPSTMKEWVPSYLQNLMEQRLGEQGTNLHQLAVMAAALEDLVDLEARDRMRTAFKIHGLPRTGLVTEEQVREVVDTYYVMFLLAGNFSAESREDALIKTEAFAGAYTGWDEAYVWMQDLLEPRMTETTYNFDKAARMVEDIGEQYYKFNDVECRDLKVTLSEMEGNKAGRVRLSQFYKKSLYSHWRFTEKADYLRVLGALDESDPSSPQVIVPNYVMARPNCLESSSLYAICCRNECEDLMGHLETNIGDSMAEPQKIVDLVSALPSDTVKAPRELSEGLVQKLEQVAASNGGKVPLHGRLFAQWMHHVYPRECPFPHALGTTSPQTPDEWIAQSGQRNSQATQEEMERTVEADTCVIGESGQPADGCGGSELPWTEEEELLVAHHAPPAGQLGGFAWLWDLAAAACLLGFLAFDRLCMRPGVAKAKDEERSRDRAGRIGWRAVLICTALSFVAHAAGLLDTVIFMSSVVVGSAVTVARYFAEKGARRTSKAEAFGGKCCV
mmetsp:Transcript_18744/g.54199  ORF Transcript_18744/g.54199 Transcript_18744/m.54199 type:complete len:607 (-) Transcript_18744:99-1919(-)